jgi:TRAP transporter TAXI family solute receptor
MRRSLLHRSILALTVPGLAVALAQGAHAQDRTGWPSTVRIGTASAGGTYHVYGGGLAALLRAELEVDALPEATGGPLHNLALIQEGLAEIGMATMGPAADSWHGKSPAAPGVEMRNLRAAFPMYQTPFQVVALAGSGIRSLADLAGQRVGVGPMGGTCATYWPPFLEALGVTDVRFQYGNANELGRFLGMRLIDAFAFCAGLPIPVFLELEQRHAVTFFALDAQQGATLAERFPVAAYEIPAGTYASQREAQHSVAMWNFAIVHKDLPDSFVYELMKLVLDDNERMRRIHAAAKETLADNLVHNAVIWFHPGAIRYYQERGFAIPEDLWPPEASG